MIRKRDIRKARRQKRLWLSRSEARLPDWWQAPVEQKIERVQEVGKCQTKK